MYTVTVLSAKYKPQFSTHEDISTTQGEDIYQEYLKNKYKVQL